ncbi:M18 family aminopeptidase [Collinsella tanakaei]|nr:M18 family aminopeptidase [Collinsella tanakaei]
MAETSAQEIRRDLNAALDLCDFISKSPSMFHTAATIRARLDAAGFTYLPEGAPWFMEPGGSYYTIRNGSSIIAWHVGRDLPQDGFHFQIAASHADSPTFKLKAVSELEGPANYLRLDIEPYGGTIDYTWFDRPLSLAGRVLVRDGARVVSRLFSLDRDVALIPSLAIHLDRSVNSSFSPNRAVDLYPLFSAGELTSGAVDALVAEELGITPDRILARDLFLVNRQAPRVWGAADEFVSAPKLDDLMCAYTALEAFLASGNERDVSVYVCFDNEEVGSHTKQGAASTLLRDTLERVNARIGRTPESLVRALAGSMLVSCDNAHAVHPNHPEKADEANDPRLNRGIVIKEAANQHYCTDAFSRAVFSAIMDDAGIPYQTFANRSDMAGGSTLGNISNAHVSMHAIDVGCPQLAMHSSYETAGARDVAHVIDALTAFYDADIRIEGADAATIA